MRELAPTRMLERSAPEWDVGSAFMLSVHEYADSTRPAGQICPSAHL
jgi:hypothetical protein